MNIFNRLTGIGVRSRLLIFFGVFSTFILVISFIIIMSAIHITESHLLSENMYYKIREVITYDIEKGQSPRLSPIEKLYSDDKSLETLGIPYVPEYYLDHNNGFFEVSGYPYSYFVYRLNQDGRNYFLEINQTEFEELEQNYLISFAIFACSGIFFTLLLACLASYQVMKPIKQIADAVKRSSETYEFKPLDIELPNDEIGYLARSCENSFKKISELLQSERLFASDVSHELRTQLAIIMTSSELLDTREFHSGSEKKALERIQNAVVFTEHLLTALLSLSRNKYTLDPDDLRDPVPVCETVIDLVRQKFKKKNVELIFRKEEYLSQGHEKKLPCAFLTTILENLLKNALRYTNNGGQVIVTLCSNTLTVTDNGAGIAEDDLKIIFEPLLRGRQAKGKGYGIGLSLVSRIASHIGWKISVSSSEGKGSTFTVIFEK